MVFNTNPNRDIANNLINDFDLNSLADVVPSKIVPSIQPVYEVYNKIANVQVSFAWTASGGGTTVYTTPVDRDFYLVGVQFSYIKDAACDQASGSFPLNLTINGTTSPVAMYETLTLTAQQGHGSHTFSVPIKIDRNTSITTTGRSFTAGTFRGRVTITGYIKFNRNNVGS